MMRARYSAPGEGVPSRAGRHIQPMEALGASGVLGLIVTVAVGGPVVLAVACFLVVLFATLDLLLR